MEQADDQTCRPVPAPRRLYPELRKSEYENVTVELINKNLNINSENIQNNANCNEKVPNNKVFLLYPSLPEDLDKISMNSMNLTSTQKSILTETNDLYGPDANENVPVYSTPRPAPRPRKPQNNDNQINYENTTIKTTALQQQQQKPLENSTGAISKDFTTGAIKAVRKAPDLPPKTYLNFERDNERRRSSYSISSEFSTTSSVHHTNDSKDTNFKRDKFNKSSASYKSSNSSLADSIESSENSKYKSASPGYVTDDNDTVFNDVFDHVHVANDQALEKKEEQNFISFDNDLFKSLGTTSKLLSESIGERVVLKAKGAKHKFDKNLKSSSEALTNIGSETTQRLKKLGANFTLAKSKNIREMPTSQFNVDRPQTLPPNDQVFNGITFTSPLGNKTKGMYDLRSQELDNSYEVPRSIKITKRDEDFGEPPSYEDVLKTHTKTKKHPINPMAVEAAARVLLKQQQQQQQNSADEEKTTASSGNNSRDSLENPSPPMPTIPAPRLSQDFVNQNQKESGYGKINPIQPPVRPKRLKNYEEIQLRRAPPPVLDAANNKETSTPAPTPVLRMNIDSVELQELNKAAVLQEREESLILREKIKEEEMETPQPDRSESWEYHEDRHSHNSSSSSYSSFKDEPVYANHDQMYGNVFELASGNQDILTPRNALINISEEEEESLDDEYDLGAVGGVQLRPPKEIIQEFDPLMSRKTTTLCRSDKSNQLLILEYLLEEDTYGSVKGEHSKSDDDISMCTSEEDNLNAEPKMAQTVKVLPTPTSPLTLEQPTTSSVNKPMQIIHQNAQLLSDSKENILENNDNDFETKVKPYLMRTEENPNTFANVDLSRPSQNRSKWFVTDDNQQGNSLNTAKRSNPFNKDDKQEDSESPPTYLEAIGDKSSDTTNKQSSSPTTTRTGTSRFMNNTLSVFSNVKIRVDALKRKASFKAQQRSCSDVKVTLQMIPRPSLSPLLVRYEGPLIRFPSGVVEDILKEMQNRKAILKDRQFQTFLDQEMKTPKEAIPLEYMTTIQCVSNNRVTDNSTHFYCFEITTNIPKNSNGSSSASNVRMSNPNLIMTSGSSGNIKHQRLSNLYGVSKESERGIWMQKLLESLTNAIPTKYTCHYYRAGWCYLKNSITSEWSGTWLVLKKSQRRLIFVSEATGNVEKLDLRKARCIVLKDNDETIKNLHVESGPMLMIDAPPFTVYMIMSSPRETKIWRHIIREVAHNNGFSLGDQQLTKFNVPVIVDKCINFVYIHGSMSEGIYRKSGSENSILKLMAAFRADAFNVEITRNEYNEHDVANVLKRFMRDLPERLMGKLSESFICVSELSSAVEKITLYKELLARLSCIERETLKKIVGHLAFISSQKTKNKMSIQNLTMIWGPTLMKNHQSEEMVYSQKEADVLCDLINLHKNLFPLAPDEMKKEQEMLMCLQKYYNAAETLSDTVKKSGDLKMWITLNPNPENTTEEKTQVNVTISPTKTTYEICQELAPKMKLSTHQVTLHEVILNGSLERPLHHDTKVFDVVLNWSYWPEDDRKHNVLIVKPIEVLNEVQRAVKNLATVTPGKELKFADNKTKSFKSYQCELRDGKIVISKKDKNDKTTIMREIFLHSTTAYLGCEKKRDFPWSWAITFVEMTHTQILRSRDLPFIGHVLAGSEWVDRTIWYSSIWYCLYGDSILPPAEIIMK